MSGSLKLHCHVGSIPSENQPENTRQKHHTNQNIKRNKQSTNDNNSKSAQKPTTLPLDDFKIKKHQNLF